MHHATFLLFWFLSASKRSWGRHLRWHLCLVSWRRHLMSLWLLLWHHRCLLLHHWGLSDIDSRGIIWIKVGELLLELSTLDFSNQIGRRSLPAHVFPDLPQCMSEELQKLATASLHKPNLNLSISG